MHYKLNLVKQKFSYFVFSSILSELKFFFILNDVKKKFFNNKKMFELEKKFLLEFINKIAYINFITGFFRFRIVLYSGLGFRRKFFRGKNFMLMYTGNRDWILLPIEKVVLVAPKRRNFAIFSTSKGLIDVYTQFFRNLQVTAVYKLKGYLDVRVRKKFLFVRRIKISGVKTKLSKKQKML